MLWKRDLFGTRRWGTERHPHRDDVDKVVLSQGVQDGDDGMLGNGHPQPLHAATHVHQDHYVLGRGGSLDVPLRPQVGGPESSYFTFVFPSKNAQSLGHYPAYATATQHSAYTIWVAPDGARLSPEVVLVWTRKGALWIPLSELARQGV